MQERIEKKRARYYFDSLRELADYIQCTPKTWTRANSSTDANYGNDWDLGAGYEKSWELAFNGWMEGAQRAQEALKVFVPATPAPDCKVDFYGHMPHVPRFCAGAPDNMIRHAPVPTIGGGHILTLIVPVNALGEVGAKYMANFGLGVAQYVNQLETDGIRVELIGAIVSQVSGWRVAHCWKIKNASQPLDLATICFAIGHPAMFRRLGFALRERCAAPYGGGYGSTVPAVLDDCINVPAGAMVLNGMAQADSVARTPERALEYISNQIDKVFSDREAA